MSRMSPMEIRIYNRAREMDRSVHSLLEEAGLSRGTIRNVRMGKQGPTATTIISLCKMLGKDPNWLLGWEEAKEHEQED